MKKLLLIIVFLTHCAIASAHSQAMDTVPIACGDEVFELVCLDSGDKDRHDSMGRCNANEVYRITTAGRSRLSAADLQKQYMAPTALECRQSESGEYFEVVWYSNGPESCGPCAVAVLFSNNGTRLSFDKTYRMSSLGRLVKELKIKQKPITEGALK